MLLNGAPYEPRRLSALIGFVPQAHIIRKELTVYENLEYASLMRAEAQMTPATRVRLVEMSLDLLGLQECRHFVCDPSLGQRLSGGQMRRVGIGVELVCDPPIMLLDEPTSALDAVNTILVVAALKDLTR
jgi:ABC-type multidrug transport system ATPase subunit